MDKKISDLPAATALTGTELIEVVQDGTSRKITADTFREWVGVGEIRAELDAINGEVV